MHSKALFVINPVCNDLFNNYGIMERMEQIFNRICVLFRSATHFFKYNDYFNYIHPMGNSKPIISFCEYTEEGRKRIITEKINKYHDYGNMPIIFITSEANIFYDANYNGNNTQDSNAFFVENEGIYNPIEVKMEKVKYTDKFLHLKHHYDILNNYPEEENKSRGKIIIDEFNIYGEKKFTDVLEDIYGYYYTEFLDNKGIV